MSSGYQNFDKGLTETQKSYSGQVQGNLSNDNTSRGMCSNWSDQEMIDNAEHNFRYGQDIVSGRNAHNRLSSNT